MGAELILRVYGIALKPAISAFKQAYAGFTEISLFVPICAGGRFKVFRCVEGDTRGYLNPRTICLIKPLFRKFCPSGPSVALYKDISSGLEVRDEPASS